MLTSLILKLKSTTNATLPASLGRAGQALLLELIGAGDAALVETLHRGGGLKPYTVSNLVLGQRRKDGKLQIRAGQEGWLRFTGLTVEVSRQLLALADQPPEVVTLGGQTLRVTGGTVDPVEHDWAGRIGYQDLAAPFLLGAQGEPDRDIRLEFTSPTTFSRQKRSLPLPLPELVFGSLLTRWQSFAPIGLHPDTRRFVEEAVVINCYELRTRGVPVKGGGMRIGFTGRVTFTILDQDRYWLNILHLLAAFAFYSGVGYQTGAGLGQTRLF